MAYAHSADIDQTAPSLIRVYTICLSTKHLQRQLHSEFKPKQEAHGPQVAHLSDIATADMQMLSNIFPILSSQLMKRSSFKQFFILKKKIYGMPVN